MKIRSIHKALAILTASISLVACGSPQTPINVAEQPPPEAPSTDPIPILRERKPAPTNPTTPPAEEKPTEPNATDAPATVHP